MLNKLILDFALWLDGMTWSTALHESFYMYNWVESTHVLALTLSLGMLFLIDLRILGYALPNVPATDVAKKLQTPMFIGFAVMIITGVLLFYAIPVRTSQSLWFRFKLVLLFAAAINALLFHRHLRDTPSLATPEANSPGRLKIGAALSIAFWAFIVICGRLIAYDWYDCSYSQSAGIRILAGCVDGQTQF